MKPIFITGTPKLFRTTIIDELNIHLRGINGVSCTVETMPKIIVAKAVGKTPLQQFEDFYKKIEKQYVCDKKGSLTVTIYDGSPYDFMVSEKWVDVPDRNKIKILLKKIRERSECICLLACDQIVGGLVGVDQKLIPKWWAQNLAFAELVNDGWTDSYYSVSHDQVNQVGEKRSIEIRKLIMQFVPDDMMGKRRSMKVSDENHDGYVD